MAGAAPVCTERRDRARGTGDRARVSPGCVRRLRLCEQPVRTSDAGAVRRRARTARKEGAERRDIEHPAAKLPAGLQGVLRRLHAPHGVFGREPVRFSGGAWLAHHRMRARVPAVFFEECTACATVVGPTLPSPAVEAAGEADVRASAVPSEYLK